MYIKMLFLFSLTFISRLAHASESFLLKVPLVKDYINLPFFDIGCWKFSLVSAFITTIILAVSFAKVAEGYDELGSMINMVLIGTPILAIIYRFLLL